MVGNQSLFSFFLFFSQLDRLDSERRKKIKGLGPTKQKDLGEQDLGVCVFLCVLALGAYVVDSRGLFSRALVGDDGGRWTACWVSVFDPIPYYPS